MAIIERFKQQAMYGRLSARTKKSGCCGGVAVIGGLAVPKAEAFREGIQ